MKNTPSSETMSSSNKVTSDLLGYNNFDKGNILSSQTQNDNIRAVDANIEDCELNEKVKFTHETAKKMNNEKQEQSVLYRGNESQNQIIKNAIILESENDRKDFEISVEGKNSNNAIIHENGTGANKKYSPFERNHGDLEMSNLFHAVAIASTQINGSKSSNLQSKTTTNFFKKEHELKKDNFDSHSLKAKEENKNQYHDINFNFKSREATSSNTLNTIGGITSAIPFRKPRSSSGDNNIFFMKDKDKSQVDDTNTNTKIKKNLVNASNDDEYAAMVLGSLSYSTKKSHETSTFSKSGRPPLVPTMLTNTSTSNKIFRKAPPTLPRATSRIGSNTANNRSPSSASNYTSHVSSSHSTPERSLTQTATSGSGNTALSSPVDDHSAATTIGPITTPETPSPNVYHNHVYGGTLSRQTPSSFSSNENNTNYYNNDSSTEVAKCNTMNYQVPIQNRLNVPNKKSKTNKHSNTPTKLSKEKKMKDSNNLKNQNNNVVFTPQTNTNISGANIEKDSSFTPTSLGKQQYFTPSGHLRYSWDSLKLGTEFGSAALNEFFEHQLQTSKKRKLKESNINLFTNHLNSPFHSKINESTNGDHFIPKLSAQDTLQIIHSLRAKTSLPPKGSALHQIPQRVSDFETELDTCLALLVI